MGFLDKAKEAISHAADRMKETDRDPTERNWPDGEDPEKPENGRPIATDPELDLDPVQGVDPELKDSEDEPYGKE